MSNPITLLQSNWPPEKYRTRETAGIRSVSFNLKKQCVQSEVYYRECRTTDDLAVKEIKWRT